MRSRRLSGKEVVKPRIGGNATSVQGRATTRSQTSRISGSVVSEQLAKYTRRCRRGSLRDSQAKKTERELVMGELKGGEGCCSGQKRVREERRGGCSSASDGGAASSEGLASGTRYRAITQLGGGPPREKGNKK